MDLEVKIDFHCRGKGLGMELIKLSHKLAEKAGCTHTYIIATGKFSQRIFQKLGYHVKFEVNVPGLTKSSKKTDS